MLRAYGQVGVKSRSVGSSKQLLNTILPTCKQLKADTRLVNLQLQTRTGEPDCPLVTEGLEGLENSD